MIAAVPDHSLLFLIVQQINELFVDLNHTDFPWYTTKSHKIEDKNESFGLICLTK